jgi:hypothetical protein
MSLARQHAVGSGYRVLVSISFLRLTTSALMSAQKKQRLISTAITVQSREGLR